MSYERWEYEIRHNSSVDLIARAMEFYRVSSDFLEVIRHTLNDDAQVQTTESAIKFLQTIAMNVARNEAGK